MNLKTPLEEIPRDWLVLIEPRLVRKGMCWLWDGATDKDGEPVINFYNPATGKRNTRRAKVRIAEMFWQDVPGHDVVHECGVLNCLNPGHFFISMTNWRGENRLRLIKEKSSRIRRYARNKKVS